MLADTFTPVHFLTTAYDADDVVAIAFRRLPDRRWEHRFVRVDVACADRFQRLLRHLNASGYDIYVSMNSFQPGRRSRRATLVLGLRRWGSADPTRAHAE